MSANVFDRIYNVVMQIPKGKVATYGEVALLAGNPRWARAVGYALHQNKDPDRIPCYRVVMRDGSLAKGFVFGGESVQRALLEADGVEFSSDGKVLMDKYLWRITED